MTDSVASAGPEGGSQGKAPADYIDQLETLLEAARRDDEAQFVTLLDELAASREQALFREVGKLTRQLHEALTSFQVDSRIADFASDEFPDARHRLDQVIAITEQSAHRTMDLVEDILPKADALIDRAAALGDAQPGGKAAGADEAALRTFAREVGEQVTDMRAGLSDVIISQNYQDLAGQEIRKVIRLVTEVEDTLINMIRVAGKGELLSGRGRTDKAATLPEGEQRITSQDEADELLSSLGF